MYKFIFLATSLICILVLLFEAKGAAKPNKNIILGVMLPSLEIKNVQVIKIVKEYMKSSYILYFLSFISVIPSVFFKSTPMFIYWILWLIIVYFIHYKIISKYNKILKDIKRENNWLLPNKHVLNIDTELTRLKSKMPISYWWFVISFLISAIPIVIELIIKSGVTSNIIISVISSILINIVCIVLFKIYAMGRTVVYSKDSAVNIACNKVYKRTWSIIYFLVSILLNIMNLFIYLSAVITVFSSNLFIAIYVILSMILIGMIIAGRSYIVSVQNKLVLNSNSSIYVDSDEYWISGIFYNNPMDNRVVVEPRIGYKSVYNLATKRGRMVEYGSIILASVVLIGAIVMLIAFDTIRYNVSINNNRIEISAPIYGIDIYTEDISEVSIIDDIEVTFKSNGIGTEDYCIGEFRVEGYGKSNLYINSEVPKYICIKTNEGYTFINGNTLEETTNMYKYLSENIN